MGACEYFAGLPDTAANAAARSDAVADVQRGVLAELTAVHARSVTSISLVDAVAATVSPGAATLLAANPGVAEVIPDSLVRAASPPAVKLSRAAVAKLLPGTCAPKGKVQLNPEAIEAIHAAGTTPSAQGLGYTGAGVTVAYIAGTGDLWLGSTNPAATFAPYVAQPGQSVSIPVTITPEGKAGTVVSGTLYVADSSMFSYVPLGGSGGVPMGSDVAALPYSYTIGG
jgi:hypothetical protein